ncbi:MAG: hypothetical protein K6T75_02400 [Acetobacteraceae bacterium]|nr:hypothetical protein [Acetobacteraceae bacterium]
MPHDLIRDGEAIAPLAPALHPAAVTAAHGSFARRGWLSTDFASDEPPTAGAEDSSPKKLFCHPDYRGRVFSLGYVVSTAPQLISTGLAGLAATECGVQLVFASLTSGA